MRLTEHEYEAGLEAFGDVAVLRGHGVFASDGVIDLVAEATDRGAVVSARVRGSRNEQYQTQIQIARNGRGQIHVQTECTCPFENMCKHGAAVFLAWQDGLDDEDAGDVSLETPGDVTPPAALTYQIENWLEQLHAREAKDLAPKKKRAALPDKFIAYVLKPNYRDDWCVGAMRATFEGKFRKPYFSTLNVNGLDPDKAPVYVEDIDLEIAARWPDIQARSCSYGYDLNTLLGDELLKAVVATGRAYVHDHENRPLVWGEDHAGSFEWHPRGGKAAQGELTLCLCKDGKPIEAVVRLQDWYWLDLSDHRIGKLTLPTNKKQAALLLAAPPIPAQAIDLLADALPNSVKQVVAPLPSKRPVERIEVSPIAVLEIKMLKVSVEAHALQLRENHHWNRSTKLTAHHLPVACIWFDYDGHRFGYEDGRGDLIVSGQTRVTRVVRNLPLEAKLAKALEPARLSRLSFFYSVRHSESQKAFLAKAPHNPDQIFFDAIRAILPGLLADGWRFEGAPEHGLAVLRPEDGHGDIGLALKPQDDQADGKIDWFDLHIGTRIDGQEVDLAPAIMAWLRALKPGARLERIEALLQPEASRGEALLPLADGRLVALDPVRLRPILEALLKLFSPREINDGQRGLSGQRLAELAEIEGVTHLAKDWINGSKGAQLAHALANWQTRPPIVLPHTFKAQLRPYQQEGLEWLNTLFRAGMGACLADDMGLGKTVQTLAHIAVLKAAGDLKGPVLIVAPTSVVPNWCHEIERFTPDLTALNFTGLDRMERQSEMASSDIVLSSYALLVRDEAILKDIGFGLVVLDEAQNIRNAATASAKAAFSLQAQQRIALSGTPVENHLGDLWSMMRFLNPGLLGDSKQFQADFRKPIEKANEADAKMRLSRRIKPFFLRRTKEQVATDLPDRTELTLEIELNPAQRDLYEVTRAAMQTRVVEAMSAKGLAQSAIVILDALLKLRQCCCDPRLVKTATKAAKAGGSAKLTQLMAMLEELGAEDRRVLVFSQFTTMLDLIEEEVKAKTISYERLDGSVRDRDGPVARFQSGQSSVFLISTKAGGAGLNLTAADTVILYDPWWNPAVEAQAIGRAHRIGQQRPVFVHRLICRDTIEEKMLALQAKKQAFAQALWASDAQGDAAGEAGNGAAKTLVGLSESDVMALFG